MKKLLAFLLALSINSYSQNIGLELGVGSSKAKVSDGTTSISTDTYSGFLAGLVIDFEYSNALSAEFGLGYDINNNLSLEAGYSTQLSNSAGPQLDGLSVKGSSFGMGLQYFFD